MKTLKNYLLNKTLITWVALCCVALMTTSCLSQKGDSSSGVEDKLIIDGSVALNPSAESWNGLSSVCGNAGLSDAEAAVCSLDELLAEVAQSGQPLSAFENEVVAWIQSAVEVRNQVCKIDKDITFLVVGTLKVLHARNLIPLPFIATAVTANPHINLLVRKIIYSVVVEAIQNGCLIDPAQLSQVYSHGGNSVGPNPPAGGAGPGTGPGTGNPGSGSSGGSSGGGSTNPGAGGSNAICVKAELRHKQVCEPYCKTPGTCDLAACTSILKVCKQYSCACN